MLINLILASLFILVAISFLLSFDKIFSLIVKMVKKTTHFFSNLEVLIQYFSRAYLRYRKSIHKNYLA